MKRSIFLGAMAMLLAWAGSADAQAPAEGLLEVDGASLGCLDFGGEGLPTVLIHAADRGAETWTEFGPLFMDRHRVLALTARGVGPSTGDASPPDVRAGDHEHPDSPELVLPHRRIFLQGLQP